MDSSYMTQLFVSMAIFAPGIILLAGLAFVGLLMLLEKTGIFGAATPKLQQPVVTPDNATANPAPGPVVAGLKGAVSAAGSQDKDAGRKAQ